MAEIVLERVTKRYGGLFRRRSTAPAVNDVSLSINHGELLAVVGPSGSGKTTLLRLIAGLEPVTLGAIRIGSRDVTRIGPENRNVAMVFQEFTLYSHMTARSNIAFPLKNRGVPKSEIQAKIAEVAASLGVGPLLDRKPGELSGGERQRVALARALVIKPDCILLDEPLSQIDPPRRFALRTLIKSVQTQSKLTMIYVTHDQQEAMMLGDRIAVIDRGIIQQVGSPMEVYRKPANRFVAEFFGPTSPTMNFIQGRIVRDFAGSALAFHADGELHIPVPPNREQHLSRNVDQEVLAAIRPEDLEDRDAKSAQRTVAINLVIESIDWLGDHLVVHGRTNSGVLLSVRRTANENTRIGDLMRVSIDPEKVHYFEVGERGANLLQQG